MINIRPGVRSHINMFTVVASGLLTLLDLFEKLRRLSAIPNYTRRIGRSLMLPRGQC